MAKIQELKDQSTEALEALYQDCRKEVFDFKCEFKLTKKLERPHLIKEKKKDIARILTILRERSVAKGKQYEDGAKRNS